MQHFSFDECTYILKGRKNINKDKVTSGLHRTRCDATPLLLNFVHTGCHAMPVMSSVHGTSVSKLLNLHYYVKTSNCSKHIGFYYTFIKKDLLPQFIPCTQHTITSAQWFIAQSIARLSVTNVFYSLFSVYSSLHLLSYK